MRVISGKYKGRKLNGFNLEGTRPTMDRVKESLFSSIQNYIPKSICLDLFAGSGALGIEALSMMAKKVIFVDNNEQAIKTIKSNLNNISNYEIINSDYKKYLKHTKEKFDIIFLDPPYQANLLNKSLKYIEKYNLLNDNGIVICEYEKENPITNLELIKEKKYGSTYIKIFKK